VRDDEFIEQFLVGHDVEGQLKSADAVDSESYESELDDLLSEARDDYELLWLQAPGRLQEGNIPPKKRKRTRKPSNIAGAWERQEALARYLAGVASKDERIIRFRKNVLSGRVLSEEQAMTFLSSPLAAARGKPDSFKQLRINPLDRILDTNYQVEETQDGFGPYRKLVWGRHHSSNIRPLLATSRLIFPGDNITPDDIRILRRGRAVVLLPHPHEENKVVGASQDSFIGQLAEIVEKSMGDYPISAEMGAWFILTGEFVPEYPVRMRYMTVRRPWVMSRTTITLEVESWVPPEEVLEQYRHAQHEILGKTPRSLKRNTLAVFEFVNQHKEDSWRELLEAWNKEYPRGPRFEDPRHLYQTFTRAVEYVAGVKPAKGKWLKTVGTDSHGFPIYAEKWYLLHEDGYTGTFDSPEEALADPRSEKSEILASEELVVRLAERANYN